MTSHSLTVRERGPGDSNPGLPCLGPVLRTTCRVCDPACYCSKRPLSRSVPATWSYRRENKGPGRERLLLGATQKVCGRAWPGRYASPLGLAFSGQSLGAGHVHLDGQRVGGREAWLQAEVNIDMMVFTL